MKKSHTREHTFAHQQQFNFLPLSLRQKQQQHQQQRNFPVCAVCGSVWSVDWKCTAFVRSSIFFLMVLSSGRYSIFNQHIEKHSTFSRYLSSMCELSDIIARVPLFLIGFRNIDVLPTHSGLFGFFNRRENCVCVWFFVRLLVLIIKSVQLLQWARVMSLSPSNEQFSERKFEWKMWTQRSNRGKLDDARAPDTIDVFSFGVC